jgi:cold shock protein
MAERVQGIVKWFNPIKGFGYITTADGVDVFVHQTDIAEAGYRTLEEKGRVEFELTETPKGKRAVAVKKI